MFPETFNYKIYQSFKKKKKIDTYWILEVGEFNPVDFMKIVLGQNTE